MKRFFIIFLILLTVFITWLLLDEHGDYPVVLEHLVSQVFRPDDYGLNNTAIFIC